MNDEAIMARRAYQKQWRAKNREKRNAYQKQWREKNPDKVKQHTERYWQRKAEAAEAK